MDASYLVALMWVISLAAGFFGWLAIFSLGIFGAHYGKALVFARVFGGIMFTLGAVVQILVLAWSLTIVFKNWP